MSGYLFSLLTFLGLLFARRLQPLSSLPLLFLMLFFPLMYYITNTAPRYRQPIDPAMGLLAVVAVACMLQALRGKKIQPADDVLPSGTPAASH